MRLSGPGARGPRARLGMSMGPWLRRPGVGQPPGRRTRRHRRDQPAGGARPHARHARPWRRVRARRGRRRRLDTALRMCDRTRGPAVATGRRSPRSPATCRGPSPPASQGRCLRRRGPQSLPRGAAPPGGDGSRWVPRARGVRRVRETPERTRCVRPGREGSPAGRRREVRERVRARRGATPRRPAPARRPKQTPTPADGRRRQSPCPTGSPAGRRTRRHRDGDGRQDGLGEQGGDTRLLRQQTPTYIEETNSPMQSVKRTARGLRDVGYLATAIFPGLGGLPFDALACDPA